MKTLVIYYSQTGNTRKAAEAVAAKLGADLAEIPCDRYPWSARGLVRAGHDSFHGEEPEVGRVEPNPSGYDRWVVGGPTWVWGEAPPVRSLLDGRETPKGGIAVFTTCGAAMNDRPLRQMAETAGTTPLAERSFDLSTLKDEAKLDAEAEAFARDIEAASAPNAP
jgi:flavodoxin